MTSETEEAVARLRRHAVEAYGDMEDDLLFAIEALAASQAEVERLRRDVNQFVTCMCGQPMSVDPYAHGHAPVSVAEHYYNEQNARAQAAEARATRAEGLLAEAGEVLEGLANYTVDGVVLAEHSRTFAAARAFLDKLKEQGEAKRPPCEDCGLDWCGATCGRWPEGSVDA